MNEGSSYDALPYPSKFFLQTHPDRLAAAGIIRGMRPAPPENCRVLDLGCGNGSNLIAQAFSLPNSRFVGIDLSATHIENAVRSAAELGLDNIEFRQMDVMQMSADEFGSFDHITAHGLVAWIPEVVRNKVLTIFRDMLAPHGIGYISYNAYPGAYSREMVRSMLLFHTNGTDEPSEKVSQAMHFLGVLTRNATDRDVHGRILEVEYKRHLEHYPADIFHDDLGEFYRPFYFYEFADLLKQHGLQFLSEAELHASSTQGIGDEALDLLDELPDRLAREQYLDFLRGRVFRQTLFCRSDIALADPHPDFLDSLFLASAVSLVDDERDLPLHRAQKFRTAQGQQLQIDHPLTKAALEHLGTVWAGSISTAELLRKAQERLASFGADYQDWGSQFETAREALLQIALSSDIVEIHSYQPRASAEPGEQPMVNRLSRWQLRDSSNVMTLLNRDLKLNDSVSRKLLELMDGTRTQQDLVRELTPFIELADDIDESDKTALKRDLNGWVAQSKMELARLGVFES